MHQNEPLPTQEEEVTYQLDENGFLMDEDNQYILDDDGQMIQLNSEQIDYLKQQQMLQEDDWLWRRNAYTIISSINYLPYGEDTINNDRIK